MTDRPLLSVGPDRGLFDLDLKDLWRYRELLYFLTWRDVKIRYKQTLLGVSWAVLQPLATIVIFTIIFGGFANLPSDGIPYPVFTLAALLPMNLFSQAITRSGTSLVDSTHLVTKVYFPRLILPVAATLAPLVDFLISLVVLFVLLFWYDIGLSWRLLTLPLFTLLCLATSLAVSIWLSALNVRYRDVRHAIPFLLQLWMYASPVVYSASIVPERWRFLYSLNPMVGVIDGFRWALLGTPMPYLGTVLISAVVVLVLFVAGVVYFKRMETTFADVI